jgi:sulfur carrier protein
MNITINGKTEALPPQSIAAYVNARGLDPKTVVVEYNGRVLAVSQWEATLLKEGDQLELLNFVGGG